jgi:uracil-DNA glycosylase
MMFADSPCLSNWAPERWELATDWQLVLDDFLASECGQQMGQFMRQRLASGVTIYPPQPLRALALTPLEQVKIVILGQDPYHGPGQAEGLAFSVAPGVRIPPSLRNIFKEIARDPSLGTANRLAPIDGSLLRWARQGVLLLNTCLTVEAGQSASHAGVGWEFLTDRIIKVLAASGKPLIFMLWGAHALVKRPLIEAALARRRLSTCQNANCLVLTASHPSPLAARRQPKPFLGCGHFGLANLFLQQYGELQIIW